MMFESDKVSYRVSEFFEMFKNEFPKVVMVEQGFEGETVTDTFDRQQVIRVHTYVSQHRVMAVTLNAANRKQLHYSIPMDYPIKLCLKKRSKWKGKKEILLRKLIKKKKLPVEVQFANNHIVIVGSSSFNTNSFPALRLVHTFEEIYLLGNFINNGVMDPRCVAIRSCIKSLRLALVTGIKGQANEHWRLFQDEQTSVANTALKFDLNNESEGAMNIAVCYDAADETHDKDPGVHYEDLQENSKDPGVHYEDLQEYSKDPGVHYEDLQEYSKDPRVHYDDFQGFSKDPHIHNEELKTHHIEPQTYYNDIHSNLYIDPFDFLQTTKSEINNEVHQSDRPSHLYADPFEFLKTNPHPVKEITERDTSNPYTPIPLSIHHVLSPSISGRHQGTTVKSLTSSQPFVSTSTEGTAPENSNTSLLNYTEQLTKM